MRPRFWELPLTDLSTAEWEALCDGCGKCCLNKLEDDETGEVAFTCVGCTLLDGETCRCVSYDNRHDYVPECVVLTPARIAEVSYWLPASCAYRLRAEGRPLPGWHHLICGDAEAVHRAGISLRGRIVSEAAIGEDEWENHIIEGFA